jgi:glucose/mannose-6-phosphate isomerase
MLDDLKYIHQRDVQDALGVAEKQWKQYTHRYTLELPEDWDPQGFAVAGMGGSALAASAISSIPGTDVPFEVIRDYNFPEFVNENWLLICSSYSGNTEEDLSIFKQAMALPLTKRPMMICVSSGGELAKLADKNDIPHVKLPGGFQPRFTFGYQYAALAQIMEAVGAAKGLTPLLERGSELVKKAVSQWEPTVPKKDNWAKQIAMEIAGKSAVIYSSAKLYAAAYKWKISMNETAKNVAWCNQYPEFNHNEFLGWTSHPEKKPYAVIDLRSQYDHPQIQKRFEISERLLSGKRPMPLVINIPKGEHVLHDMMWAIAFGDFVSIYLALANGVNPTPVDLIEKLKAEL